MEYIFEGDFEDLIWSAVNSEIFRVKANGTLIIRGKNLRRMEYGEDVVDISVYYGFDNCLYIYSIDDVEELHPIYFTLYPEFGREQVLKMIAIMVAHHEGYEV